MTEAGGDADHGTRLHREGRKEWTARVLGGFLGLRMRTRPDGCTKSSSGGPIPPSGASGTGDPCWDRTSDTLIKSQVLYRLS